MTRSFNASRGNPHALLAKIRRQRSFPWRPLEVLYLRVCNTLAPRFIFACQAFNAGKPIIINLFKSANYRSLKELIVVAKAIVKRAVDDLLMDKITPLVRKATLSIVNDHTLDGGFGV